MNVEFSQQQLAPVIDARPILPASAESLWNDAAGAADRLASRISAALQRRSIDGWVRRSAPGEYPYVVAVDLWQPVQDSRLVGVHDRSHLSVSITVQPYLQHPIDYRVELSRHGRKYQGSHWFMSDDELDDLIKYLLSGGRTPKFFRSRVPWTLSVVRSILPFISAEEYENRLVEEAKPSILSGFTIPVLIALSALAFSISQFAKNSNDYLYDGKHPEIFFGLVSLAVLVACAWVSNRRPVYQVIAKQPFRTPRREFLVDSWQVSVPEAGREFASFDRRLAAALRGIGEDIEIATEKYQFFTPRGFETRDRVVLSKGQANVHVHVQPFGRDTFVGWESFLNWARWSESAPVSSVVRNGKRFEYKSLVAGAHLPSKFDLMELNALAETVHRNLVREIKAYLKEREIEADLDFRIIRGDRNRALSEGKDDKRQVAGGQRFNIRARS